jgi:hypothetical protein
MDAAYDAAAIATHSRACGHVSLTDPNFRADTAGKAERDAEVRRRAPIHLPAPTKRPRPESGQVSGHRFSDSVIAQIA